MDAEHDGGAPHPRKAPVPGLRPPPGRQADFAWGFVTASLFGIVGPFLTWFFSPLVMLIVGSIGFAKRDRRQPKSFANGLYCGAILWFLINGSCSAYFGYMLSSDFN